MNTSDWQSIVWNQFGASIEMLENAIAACPDTLWDDRTQRPEFWYVAFHALFFLDFYLSDSEEAFAPPAPFTRDELDPAGLLPERPYTKTELQTYLEHGRRKCRAAIQRLTEEMAVRRCGFDWLDLSVAELLLYNMRHVQHHAAQLQLLLRQKTESAPRWVRKAKTGMGTSG
jgi:DinB superfamily